ncbi:Ca2+-dependent phosphoinositide-specific phospholipase C [uncultured Thiodictyon sp.]|uniref:Ca2+-dependent phosphoinositide-specific phospholipase C n=1 Tax=uncultured Thiodictyon sp. TaxID=1846217 RepID=UPI0025EDEDC8|nr:Ca2+-dependent phosphoinositide-specific phospholipase C [uncultured Thiodictyon sp.]
MSTLRYNQVRQKSSHNSYQRTEGYLDQALYWRVHSLEMDIHTSNNDSHWPALTSDWYVYHKWSEAESSVNTLSDALDVLKAFHLAVPEHEVLTIWVDFKDNFTATGNHTPEAFDELLRSKLGRDAIWGPPDLIGDSANLQTAVAAKGWPTLERLRGKFIFAGTTGNLSSSDSQLNQYVDNGKTASQRLAFVAPEITKSGDITAYNYAVVFNLNSDHYSVAADVFAKGFVSRVYGSESKSSWCNAWKSSANHLGTDKVSSFEDAWARTDMPATGYPFSAIGSSATDGLVESGDLFAIEVKSGDLWDKSDSCYLQYDDRAAAPQGTRVAFVGNPSSHVDGWIKAGLMARASTAANAAYVAVLRTGANGLHVQYRGAADQDTKAIEAVIPKGVNGHGLVDKNTPIWIRLDVATDGKSATGYYSIDGTTWLAIGSGSVDAPLKLQGWVASSHGADTVKWLFGGAAAPQTAVAIGSKASGSFIGTSAAAASLGAKASSACCN